MAERHRVRVVFECEVEVNDISMAAIEKRKDEWFIRQIDRGYVPETLTETPSEAEVEDLRLLQEALRADPERLAEWVKFEVAVLLDSHGIRGTHGISGTQLDEDAEADILMPVVETLPPAQRHKFREALAKRQFLEIADEFYMSFDTKVRSVRVKGDPRHDAR